MKSPLTAHCMLAKKLGYKDAARLLEETLKEEKATDEKLTVIADQQP